MNRPVLSQHRILTANEEHGGVLDGCILLNDITWQESARRGHRISSVNLLMVNTPPLVSPSPSFRDMRIVNCAGMLGLLWKICGCSIIAWLKLVWILTFCNGL